MESFSNTIDYRVVNLKTATDAVRFSFIVRNSISYLDLGLCRYATISNLGSSCDCCALKFPNAFVNTEEKCRKLFTKSRSLLYTLHLDLPKGREGSLKGVPNSSERDPWNPHIDKVILTCGFDLSILFGLVEDAIENNKEKLKILAWILKISYSNMPLISLLDIRIVNKFIDHFYPEITDSAIFKDFIMHFDFLEWMFTHEKPETLEHLLYYSRHYGLKEWDYCFSGDEAIDHWILNHYFLNIGPILKYINGPTFVNEYYHLYFLNISLMRPNLTEKKLLRARKWMKRERMHMMLQFIWMYFDSREHHFTEASSEALRLIWSSVPDAYISFKEVRRAFQGSFKLDELKNMYDFYASAVGEFSERAEPRSLQHQCRTLIRSTLCENRIWIPEGIGKMCLPKSVESFLNLEKVFSTTHKSDGKADFNS